MCFCTVNRWVISLSSAEKGKPYQNLTSYNLACCCYKTQHGICAGAGCWELRTNYLWLQSKKRWHGRLECPMFYQSRVVVVVVNLSVRCFLLVDVICVSQCACLGVIQEWTPKANFTHHAHTAAITTVAASERFVVTGSKDETIQLYDMKKRVEHGALLHHNGMSCSTSGCNCHSGWSNFTCILECNSCPYWCHIWDWSGSENSPCYTGTITSLEFYGSSHLLSGGEDGLVCVWDTKKWQCLKSIRAHKYAAEDATKAEIFVSVASWLRKHEPSCPLLFPRGSVMSLSVHPSGRLALTVGTDQTLRWNSDILQILIEEK